MGVQKKTTRAIVSGISWAALFAGVEIGYELIRYGKVNPESLNFFIGPVVGFLGGFAGTRWGKNEVSPSGPAGG
ncbi:hypothetical protein [Streptomyces sp. NPDC050548]|uniref:hypothetical protein n=1 Tax=Streptomyces sp. NPDC050548 TaxID=3365629 RepID=UPI0037991697